jgi:predicted permease
MVGRLRPGVSLARANAEVETLFDSWRTEKAAAIAATFRRSRFLKERAEFLPAASGLNGLRYQFFEPLAILMSIVALVLLLACANLSGLMLARAASRQREISVRRALGAGNGRLARQFLAESLLLASLGAGLGFAFAQWFSRALIVMMANGDRFDLSVRPDWRVLAFTCGVSLAACLLSGLVPGLHAGRGAVNPALKEVRSGRHRGLGRMLVVAQLAISMTLLVGASLFIRTLVKIYSVDTGVRAGGVLTFGVTTKHHFTTVRSAAIEASIVGRLQSLPGVAAATASVTAPLTGGLLLQRIRVEGYQFHSGEDDGGVFNTIAPGFFIVTGIPLLLGRDFNERDVEGSNPVAIVNQTFAHEFFGNQPPLARHVTTNNVTYEIVGVVQDSKYDLRKAVLKTVYIPWTQQGNVGDSNRSQPTGFTYLARVSSGDPLSLAPPMERAIPEIDSALRLRTPQTLQWRIDRSTLNERMMAALGGFFGLLALIVACLGIFGVLAFQVSRRINELGVRIALGATRANIVGPRAARSGNDARSWLRRRLHYSAFPHALCKKYVIRRDANRSGGFRAGSRRTCGGHPRGRIPSRASRFPNRSYSRPASGIAAMAVPTLLAPLRHHTLGIIHQSFGFLHRVQGLLYFRIVFGEYLFALVDIKRKNVHFLGKIALNPILIA